MEEQAIDAIGSDVAEEIDKNTSFSEALNNVLQSNDSLSKSKTWTKPTHDQRRHVRERITSDRRTNMVTVSKNNKKYVQVDQGNYQKVLDKGEGDYFYNPKTGRHYLRGPDGTKEIIEKE